MKPTKRRRDGLDEGDSPSQVSKQLKIYNFYTANVPIANRFSVLEGLNDSPDVSAVSANSAVFFSVLEGVATNAESTRSQPDLLNVAEEWDVGQAKGADCLPSNDSLHLISLVAKTVEHVCKLLNALQFKVDNLTNLLALSEFGGLISSETRGRIRAGQSQPSNGGCVAEGPKAMTVATSKNITPEKFQLVLQPTKISLTVFKYNGHMPFWLSKSAAKRHLMTLLGRQTRVDNITDLEVLTSGDQAKRVILTFGSTEIPTILLWSKNRLNSMGIFPTRVYKNITLLPLIRTSRERLPSSLPMPFKRQLRQNGTAGNVECSHSAAPSNPISPSIAKLSPPSKGALLDEEVLDANIQEECMDLPEQGQRWILDRIESLKEKLIDCVSQGHRKTTEVDVMIHVDSDCNNSIPAPCTCPDEKLPGVIQSPSLSNDAQPLIREHPPNMEVELVGEPRVQNMKNGCVCTAMNNSLEPLVVTD